ncbi:MAG: hypothetical protein ACT4PT_03830 [Methanobacteriota archaeon]
MGGRSVRLALLVSLVSVGAMGAAETPVEEDPFYVPATPDFEVAFDASGRADLRTGSAPTVENATATPDAGAAFNVTKWGTPAKGSVVFRAGFWNVTGPRQVLPKVGDRYFSEFYSTDLTNASPEVAFVNITGNASEQVFRFSLPVGRHRISFVKDVVPPTSTVGEIEHLTHFSFVLTSETDEPTLATLWIRPADGSREPVPYPTPHPAFRQTFPVQALRENATHVYWIEFEDFSGNHARTDDLSMRTLPKPVFPSPVLLSFRPFNHSNLSEPPSEIRAVIGSPNGPIPSHGVRLFFDLREVTENITFDGANVTYRVPQPLAPGPHRVGLEVRDSVGGEEQWSWRFAVVEAETPSAAPIVALLGAAGLAFLCRRRLLRR